MSLIDTHCHIHDADYPLDASESIIEARKVGVTKMICVGTSQASSHAAISLAKQYDGIYAAIGVHPHDTQDGWGEIKGIVSDLAGAAPLNVTPDFNFEPKDTLVAIGEIGLDYFYTHSPRATQIQALESQIQTAVDNNLPIIFHVREAFDDFWPIFDNFHGIRGVLHSFTDTQANLDQGFKRDLFVGVNGISTFTKDTAQKEMFAAIPLDKMVLETDAPFLTPVPKRGKVNQPAFVSYVAAHHAAIRGISIDDISGATSKNATALFAL